MKERGRAVTIEATFESCGGKSARRSKKLQLHVASSTAAAAAAEVTSNEYRDRFASQNYHDLKRP